MVVGRITAATVTDLMNMVREVLMEQEVPLGQEILIGHVAGMNAATIVAIDPEDFSLSSLEFFNPLADILVYPGKEFLIK